MPLLDDIAHYLDDQSSSFTILSGTGGAGNLSKGWMPDHAKSPNTVLALLETGGGPPHWSLSTGTTSPDWEQAGLQVLSRSTSYATARSQAYLAYRLLDVVANKTLPHTSSGTVYLRIDATQPPFSIGRDGNGRFLHSLNFTVLKERS